MPINRSFNPKQLEEGLNAIFGQNYKEFGNEYQQIFSANTSTKHKEEDVLMTGFGAAVRKTEGSSVTYDQAVEAWAARYIHNTYALAFSITEEDIDDNLYNAKGAKFSKALARSMNQTKEIIHAAILNNGFDSNFTGGDGVSLFSTSHPLVGGGVASNTLATPADFSESALEDVLIMQRRAVDDRSLPISIMPKDVVIPPEEEYNALRILRSTLRAGTADNDINAVAKKGIFTRDPVLITRLTDPDAWMVTTDCPDGLKTFTRKGITKKFDQEFNTGNHRYLCKERYSAGWTDWRGIYGSAGAG